LILANGNTKTDLSTRAPFANPSPPPDKPSGLLKQANPQVNLPLPGTATSAIGTSFSNADGQSISFDKPTALTNKALADLFNNGKPVVTQVLANGTVKVLGDQSASSSNLTNTSGNSPYTQITRTAPSTFDSSKPIDDRRLGLVQPAANPGLVPIPKGLLDPVSDTRSSIIPLAPFITPTAQAGKDATGIKFTDDRGQTIILDNSTTLSAQTLANLFNGGNSVIAQTKPNGDVSLVDSGKQAIQNANDALRNLVFKDPTPLQPVQPAQPKPTNAPFEGTRATTNSTVGQQEPLAANQDNQSGSNPLSIDRLIKDFQRSLGVTPDGIIGPETRAAALKKGVDLFNDNPLVNLVKNNSNFASKFVSSALGLGGTPEPNATNQNQGVTSQPKIPTTPIGSSIGGVLGNTTPSNASTPITFNQLVQNVQQWAGLKGSDVDGKLGPQTTSAVLNTAAQNATDFAKKNPELVTALAVNAIAGGGTPNPNANIRAFSPPTSLVGFLSSPEVVNPTLNVINNTAGALDRAIKQATENDNYRDLHSDDPVERAFNGIVAMGTPVLQAFDAAGNHIVAIADAGKQLSQDPHLLDTIGNGFKGTASSTSELARNVGEGWQWVAQNPGTAVETAKLVGGDIQTALERQMNEDPSGFAASTVLNIGTLLTPVSAAKVPSFTLAPLKAATTVENLVTTAIPVIDGKIPLWRAVKDQELNDILNTNSFRNPYGIENKYFSRTEEGAASFAQQAFYRFKDPAYTTVRTSIPNSLITPDMLVDVDRGIRTIVVPTEALPSLSSPVVLPTMSRLSPPIGK
jgi:hypothetical protein